MEGLFSKRFSIWHELPHLTFSRTLRRRLAKLCASYDNEDWNAPRETYEALDALRMAYGLDELRVQDVENSGQRDATDFHDFLEYCYPTGVLDAIEAFLVHMGQRRDELQERVNAVLQEEGSHWRFWNDQAYLLDSQFADVLKERVADELQAAGFGGACDELTDARHHLAGGEADDAIVSANKAYESALMSLLSVDEGTADDLLKQLRRERFLDGIPDVAQKALVTKVLNALPVLRHKLGAHGQGAATRRPPRAYGELAINLSVAYLKFLLDLQRNQDPPVTLPETEPRGDDDEIPF